MFCCITHDYENVNISLQTVLLLELQKTNYAPNVFGSVIEVMSKRCKYTRLIHPKSLTELTRRSTTVYGRIHEFPSKYVLRNLYGFHIEKHVKRAFTYSSYMNSKKMADINVNSMTILLLYKSVNKNLQTVLFTHNGNLQ